MFYKRTFRRYESVNRDDAFAALKNYKVYRKKAEYLDKAIEDYAVSTFSDTIRSTQAQLKLLNEMFARQREYKETADKIKTTLKKLDHEYRFILIHNCVRKRSYHVLKRDLTYSERTFYRLRERALDAFAELYDQEETTCPAI